MRHAKYTATQTTPASVQSVRLSPLKLSLGAAALIGLTAGIAHAKTPESFMPATHVAKAAPAMVDAAQTAYAALRQGDRAGALALFETIETPDAQTLRMIGDLRFSEKDADGALIAWQAGFEQSDSVALAQRVTHGAVEVGDFELATKAATRMVDIWDAQSGTDASARRALQRSLAVLSEVATLAGDFTTGEDAARRLIRLTPKTPIGHLSLAYVHLQASEYTDAEEIYLDVLEIDPGNTTALNNLGNVYYMQQDLDLAAERFEAILNVDNVKPYSESLALSNLGELLQLQGATKDAEALYTQAIEAQPKGAWGYMGLAALYDISGRYDDAVDAMISGWERDDNRMTRLNMHFYQPEWYWQRDALIAEIEGDVPTAIALWEKVQHGQVDALHKAAAWHLDTLADE